MCNCVIVMPLYYSPMSRLGCGNPVFIRREYKRKPSKTVLSPSDSQAFYYWSLRFMHVYIFISFALHEPCQGKNITNKGKVRTISGKMYIFSTTWCQVRDVNLVEVKKGK